MSGLLPGDTASVHVESEAAVYGGLQGVDAEENEMSFDGVEMLGNQQWGWTRGRDARR